MKIFKKMDHQQEVHYFVKIGPRNLDLDEDQ